MKYLLKWLPVWLVLVDLFAGVSGNIRDALLPVSPAPHDGLPVAPETAFGWLQAVANGGMAALLAAAVWVLLGMRRRSDAGEKLAITPLRFLSALAVLAFAVPSLWLWFWTLAEWMGSGRLTLSADNPRYLLSAACQPFMVWVVLGVWRSQCRLRRVARVSVAPVPRDMAD